MRLHHVRRDAAGIEQRVVHAGVARHVLAHVVDADIHQFDRIERAAAEMRRGRGMRGAAGEDEIGAGVGERGRHHHFPETMGMPGQCDVGIVERACAHHEGFCRAAFFRRTAVIAHASGHFMSRQPILDRRGRKQCGRAEQVVAAAMAVAVRFDRPRLGDPGLLAEAGQRVVFAEEGNHRTVFAPFAHHGGRNARNILGDAESLMAQLGKMLGRRARLGVADLGHAPDPVGKRSKSRLDSVDASPDVAAVVHGTAPEIEETRRLAVSRTVLKLLMRGPFMHDRLKPEQKQGSRP